METLQVGFCRVYLCQVSDNPLLKSVGVLDARSAHGTNSGTNSVTIHNSTLEVHVFGAEASSSNQHLRTSIPCSKPAIEKENESTTR